MVIGETYVYHRDGRQLSFLTQVASMQWLVGATWDDTQRRPKGAPRAYVCPWGSLPWTTFLGSYRWSPTKDLKEKVPFEDFKVILRGDNSRGIASKRSPVPWSHLGGPRRDPRSGSTPVGVKSFLEATLVINATLEYIYLSNHYESEKYLGSYMRQTNS